MRSSGLIKPQLARVNNNNPSRYVSDTEDLFEMGHSVSEPLVHTANSALAHIYVYYNKLDPILLTI